MSSAKEAVKSALEMLKKLRDDVEKQMEKKTPSVSDTVTFTRSPESDAGWAVLGRSITDQARMFGKFGEQHVMDAVAVMPENIRDRLQCRQHGPILVRTLAANVLVGELANMLHQAADELQELAENAGRVVMKDNSCRDRVAVGEIECGGEASPTGAAASFLIAGIIEASGLMLVRYKQPEKQADKPAQCQTGSDTCCS